MVGVPREATVLTLFEAPGWQAVEGIFLLCTFISISFFCSIFYLTQFICIDDYFWFMKIRIYCQIVADHFYGVVGKGIGMGNRQSDLMIRFCCNFIFIFVYFFTGDRHKGGRFDVLDSTGILQLIPLCFTLQQHFFKSDARKGNCKIKTCSSN